MEVYGEDVNKLCWNEHVFSSFIDLSWCHCRFLRRETSKNLSGLLQSFRPNFHRSGKRILNLRSQMFSSLGPSWFYPPTAWLDWWISLLWHCCSKGTCCDWAAVLREVERLLFLLLYAVNPKIYTLQYSCIKARSRPTTWHSTCVSLNTWVGDPVGTHTCLHKLASFASPPCTNMEALSLRDALLPP